MHMWLSRDCVIYGHNHIRYRLFCCNIPSMKIWMVQASAVRNKSGSRRDNSFRAVWIKFHLATRPCMLLRAGVDDLSHIHRCNIEQIRKRHSSSIWFRRFLRCRRKHTLRPLYLRSWCHGCSPKLLQQVNPAAKIYYYYVLLFVVCLEVEVGRVGRYHRFGSWFLMFYFILFVVRHYSLCVFVWILERSLEVEVVGTIPTIPYHTIPYHTSRL